MDRNPFHFAHPAVSGASQAGMAVAYEFHETSRNANTPPALAILLATFSSRQGCNLPTIACKRFANYSAAPESAAAEPACRQYRAVRWFLLPEAGLRQRRPERLAGISVVANFATTAADGKTYQVEYYNLDMILSIGYRVKSSRGVKFRRWANKVAELITEATVKDPLKVQIEGRRAVKRKMIWYNLDVIVSVRGSLNGCR